MNGILIDKQNQNTPEYTRVIICELAVVSIIKVQETDEKNTTIMNFHTLI